MKLGFHKKAVVFPEFFIGCLLIGTRVIHSSIKQINIVYDYMNTLF